METHVENEGSCSNRKLETYEGLDSDHSLEAFNKESGSIKENANIEKYGNMPADGLAAAKSTEGSVQNVANGSLGTGCKCSFVEERDGTFSASNVSVNDSVGESFCLHAGTEERVKLVTSYDIECVGEDKRNLTLDENESSGEIVETEKNVTSSDSKNFTSEDKLSMNESLNREHIGEHWVTRNLKTFELLPLTNIDKLLFTSGCEDSVFHDLPVELIVKIFSYLTTRELCLNVAPVCRKWRQISLDHSLWKSLDFSTRPHLSSLNLLWVMRRAPLLKQLIVSGRVNITRAEVAIFTECCRGIQDIDFGFCDNLSGDMIQCLSDNCLDLMKINVEGCDNLQKNCLKYLVKCKKLSHLNFSHCMFLQDSGVIFLAKGLPIIRSINLDGISFLTDR